MLQHAQFAVGADAEDRSIIQPGSQAAARGCFQQVIPVKFVLGLGRLFVLRGGGNQGIDLPRTLSCSRWRTKGRQRRKQKAEYSGNQTFHYFHGGSLSQSR